MAQNETGILVVDVGEDGQPRGMRRLEGTDTIANERLNADIRNAGTNATTALNTATSALDEAIAVSSTVYANSGTWGAGGGIDAGLLANITEVSVGFKDFSGNSQTSTVGVCSVVDSLEVSTRNLSGILDGSTNFPNTLVTSLEVSTRNLSAILDGSTNYPNTLVTSLEVSTRNLSSILDSSTDYPNTFADGTFDQAGRLKVNLDCNSNNITNPGTVDGVNISNRNTFLTQLAVSTQNLSGILDGSTNYPNTIVTNTFAGNSQLAANLNANGNSISNCASVSGSGGILDLSSTFLILTSPEGGIRIGPSRTDTATWTKTGINKAASSFDYSLCAWSNLTTLSSNFLQGVGGGSAVASALFVANGSSVEISGADGSVIDTPEGGSVLSLNEADGKLAFRKIRAINIGNNEIGEAALADDSVGPNQLQTGAASGNIAIGGLALNKLTPIAAGNFLGNPNTLGAPVESVDKATARNMLGVSAGTAAPPSPAEGDLWYNTTHDELYTYDSGRGHWLGCPYYISMGKANAATGAGVGHFLYVGHQGTAATTQEKGWLVPHDMVITGWRGHSSTTFNGWNARIDKNSGGTNTTGIVQTGVLGAVDTFSDFTLDVDVAAGDILGVALVLGSVTIDASTVIIKIQRKGA